MQKLGIVLVVYMKKSPKTLVCMRETVAVSIKLGYPSLILVMLANLFPFCFSIHMLIYLNVMHSNSEGLLVDACPVISVNVIDIDQTNTDLIDHCYFLLLEDKQNYKFGGVC